MRDLHVPAAVSDLGVELAAAPNPLQTWVNTFINAFNNLTAVAHGVIEQQAPVAQQVTANLINYAAIDLGAYQSAAAGLVAYYGGATGQFARAMQQAVANLEGGQISAAVTQVYNATVFSLFYQVLFPMESALVIPIDIANNMAAAASYIFGTAITDFIPQLGADVLLGALGPMQLAAGTDLQAAYDSAVAGNWLGAVASLVDIPGALTNALLNGDSGNTGLLGPLPSGGSIAGGVLGTLLQSFPQLLSATIVSPGAQDIMAGGSVGAAVHEFVTQLTTGWPTPAEWASVPVGIAAGLKGLPEAIAGAIATALKGLLGGTVPSGAAIVPPAGAATVVSPAARTVTLPVAQPGTVSPDSSVGGDAISAGGSSARLRTPDGSTPSGIDTSVDNAGSQTDTAAGGASSSPDNRAPADISASSADSTTGGGSTAGSTTDNSSAGSVSGVAHRASVGHQHPAGGSARHAHTARRGRSN